MLRRIVSTAPLVFAGLVWEITAFKSQSRFVPHLSALAVMFWQSLVQNAMIEAQGGGRHGYAPHIWATLKTFTICFACGTFSGSVVSLCMFPLPTTRRIWRFVLRPWHTVPPLIAIPVAFTLLGPSWMTDWIAGSFYAFIATSIFMSAALEEVPHNFISLARLAGAGPFWIAWRVRCPFVLPILVGPAKVVASFTLGIVIIIEFLASPEGIGRVMKFALSYHSVELLLVGVMWASILGLTCDLAIDRLSRILIPWANRTAREAKSLELLTTQRLANQ